MAFEVLFHKPNSEPELIDQITAHVQKNFEDLKGRFFFVKVDLVNLELSKLVWEKELPTRAAPKDFYYETKMKRCCFGIRYDDGHFEAYFSGFSVSARFQIFEGRMVMESYPSIHECDPDAETYPMIPREVVEGGFGDLTEQFEQKLKKAV
jgi:hypothetical protein